MSLSVMNIVLEAVCNDVHYNVSYFAAWFTFTCNSYTQICTEYFETIWYLCPINYEHFSLEERGQRFYLN